MESFKDLEKETKTKAYSKEALARGGISDDPLSRARRLACEYLEETIDTLAADSDRLNEELDQAQDARKPDMEELEMLGERLSTHSYHLEKLKLIQAYIADGILDPADLDEIKEDIEYYVESNAEPDFYPDLEMYDDLEQRAQEAEAAREAEASRAKAQAEAVAAASAAVEADEKAAAAAAAAAAAPAPAPAPAHSSSTTAEAASQAKRQDKAADKKESAAAHTPAAAEARHEATASAASSAAEPATPTRAVSAATSAAAAGSPTPSRRAVTMDNTPSKSYAASAAAGNKPARAPEQPSLPKSSVWSTGPPTSAAAASSAYTADHSPATTATTASHSAPPGVAPPLLPLAASSADMPEQAARVPAPFPAPALGGPSGSLTSLDALRALEASVKTLPIAGQETLELSNVSLRRMSNRFSVEVMPNTAKPKKVYSSMDDMTLFFIFFMGSGVNGSAIMESGSGQYYAAQALHEHHWVFHKGYATWIKPVPNQVVSHDKYEQGTFEVFDYRDTWTVRSVPDLIIHKSQLL